MPHIFLSYSRQDTAFMQRIRDDLRAADLAVWTDESLEPGTPAWELEIAKAIEGSDRLVVILSPEAKESVWVGRELGYAETFGVKIYPILVRGDERSAVPFRLISHQWVDSRSDYDTAFGKLVRSIAEHLASDNVSSDSNAALSEPLMPELIDIPAGPFLMGSDPTHDPTLKGFSHARKTEQPQTTISLPAYQIGRYSVTVEECTLCGGWGV
ncbi:TIR domain-containing protein [Chloroflexota bacterium]